MTHDRTKMPPDELMGKVVEEWRPVAGYQGIYEVSNLGGVRSIDRRIINSLGHHRFYPGKTMSQRASPRGEKRVDLWDRKGKSHFVHRLVAEAFCEKPDDAVEVNHINGDPRDNRAVNLEWVTKSQNIQHAYDNGLATPNPIYGEKNPKSKLKASDLAVIEKMKLDGKSSYEIASEFGVNASTIQRVLKKKTWRNAR